MRSGSALQALHQALGAAQLRDLPDVSRQTTDWGQVQILKKRLGTVGYAAYESQHGRPERTIGYRPQEEDLQVDLFEQLWGSTALGYGGIGGAAMTSAYTVVVRTPEVACIYFGGSGLAYCVALNTPVVDVKHQAFLADLQARQLASRRDAVARYGAQLPGPPARD